MFGYWVSLGVLLVMTTTAWHPFRRPGWLAAVSYQTGWLVNEVPAYALIALAATTVLTGAEGHLNPFGLSQAVAVAVAAVIVAMLMSILARARGVRRIFADALCESGIEPPAALQQRRSLGRALHSYLLPFMRRGRGIRRVRNIPYGEHGRRNLLDVYVAANVQPRGVFVHFHGGHFRIGRKSTQSMPLIYQLARAGWVCVSANYRLEPRWTYPAYVEDAKRVIAWARAHAEEYGADPSMVVAGGDSAGGYLALYAALTPGEPALQPGFETADTTLQAALVLYGYLGPTAQTADSAPISHITADAPPVFIVQGTNDNTVPLQWTEQGLARLRATSRSPMVYAELPGAQHTFDYVRSPRSDALADATEAFLDNVVARHHSTTREELRP